MLRYAVTLLIALYALVPICAMDFVKIGFWNIEHLGNRTPPQRPIAIAEHIALSGVDILSLCEIHVTDEEQGKKVNDVLDTAFEMLNEEEEHDWEYLLLPKKRQDATSQLTGIAWNKRQVTKVGDPFRIDINDDPNDDFSTWDRHPHATKFSAGQGRTDFILIPLHMKANVPPSDPRQMRRFRSGAEFGAAQRNVEAKLLVEGLASLSSHFEDEEDIILLGDTNILSADEAAIEHFEEAGFRDLNDLDVNTFVRSEDAPFDRIFMPTSQREFDFARQQVLLDTAPVEHEEFLSDHYLILTTFRVQPDDD